jgi:hypothetical protein
MNPRVAHVKDKNIKNVSIHDYFHPFKSSARYFCLNIVKRSKDSITLDVLAINFNTKTIRKTKKHFNLKLEEKCSTQ